MKGVLEIEGLRKRYGRLTALAGVDLSVGAGRVLGLVGPNAAGKSTLIKSVLGLVRPDGGRIGVNGVPVGDDPAYRHAIGYMPQAPRFPDNLTGREVLDLLADLRGGEDADDTLLHVLGLDSVLDRPVRVLSGGTRQKLNAAVAFRYRPPLLILDEPTASLDPVAAGRLKAHIRASAEEGTAVLLTSHTMADMEELADELVYLVDGSVRFHGTLDTLRLKTGERKLERAVAALMQEAA
jgi:Cu-processing system ATP-binding protein